LSHCINADIVNRESKWVSCPVEMQNSKPPFPFYIIKTFVVINTFIDLGALTVLFVYMCCFWQEVVYWKFSSIIVTRAFT